LVVAWLAGARVLELKTVQRREQIPIPRPSIDAPDVGYNVEWSQELTLAQSAAEYLTAWVLVHVLGARGLAEGEPVFDASVGYDLAGLGSDGVARFLDTLTDAREALAAWRAALPRPLAAAADVPVPTRVIGSATLSTFHGCPPDEIERMVEHLFRRHALDVVVKLNPTLLGYEAVESLLHDRLGYHEIELDRDAFTADLVFDAATAMLSRLAGLARRMGRRLGVKFTNTLVVRNHRGRLAGERVYLSGPPLHALAITLAERFRAVDSDGLPISFSAGLDAENLPEVVACGFAPVTTCTDLLRPTGYRRLPRMLRGLEDALEGAGATNLAEWIRIRAGSSPAGDPVPAARSNLRRYASEVAGDPRYAAERHRAEPERTGRLAMLDCASCNNCVLVCPNGAFFSLAIPPQTHDAPRLGIEDAGVVERPGRMNLVRDRQWVMFADACNACGNCDTHCPERGDPARLKPCFHGDPAGYASAAPADGILIESGGRRVRARLGGREYRLERDASGTRFDDGVIEVTLDDAHRVRDTHIMERRAGHELSLARYHELRLLTEAVMTDSNPVSARFLPVLAGDGGADAAGSPSPPGVGVDRET
jgi:putative selenate reductase